MFSPQDSNTVEEISLPVFSGSTVIDSEPLGMTRDQERAQLQATRRPIPVSTIDWQTSITSHFSPLSGLDFLIDATELIIQQSVELSDLMTNVESENRYTIKVPRGETIYFATESSTSFQRTCFGSSRAFGLRLYDPTQQAVVQYNRRLACGVCCSLLMYLQEIEVVVPPGDYVGKIKQQFNMLRPMFLVHNKQNTVIYKIEGPDAPLSCFMGKNYNFQVFSADGQTQIGSIVHQWDQIQVAYNLSLQLPRCEQNTRHKALLLGAAFLLEYMYFENTKKRAMCKCIC